VRRLLVLGFGLRKRLVRDVAFDVGHLGRDPVNSAISREVGYYQWRNYPLSRMVRSCGLLSRAPGGASHAVRLGLSRTAKRVTILRGGNDATIYS
jgi:hypothetical protein